MNFSRRNCVAIIAAVFVTVGSLSVKPAWAHRTKHVVTQAGESLQCKCDQDRIYSLIRITRSGCSRAFAHKASEIFCIEAHKEQLPPLFCASVGYAESHFDQDSEPCIGIMQVHLPSLREYIHKKQGDFRDLDPDDRYDNIRIGVRELGLYRPRYHTLRRILGRYNGCGPDGAYVDRVMNVFHCLKTKNPTQWKSLLKNGNELWQK